MSTITLEKAMNHLRAKEAQLVKTQQVVAALLRPDNAEYVDDHNRGDRIQSLNGWVLVEYNDQVCPFPIKGMGACLNPLYLSEEDGKVHLSRWSIGPYFSSIEALDAAGVRYYTV